MNTLNFILGASLQPGDFTGFTFFIGSVSMLAATVFFLVQHGQVDKKFKDSMPVFSCPVFTPYTNNIDYVSVSIPSSVSVGISVNYLEHVISTLHTIP